MFEHFSSDVAFQHADGFADRFAFFGAAFHIPFRLRVRGEAAEDDLVEGMVGLAVTAPIEPMPDQRRQNDGK